MTDHDPFANLDDDDSLVTDRPDQIAEVPLVNWFSTAVDPPNAAVLAEIRDLLVTQGKYLRVLAADVERRAWPLVYVPDGEPGEEEQPFVHYKELLSERAARS